MQMLPLVWYSRTSIVKISCSKVHKVLVYLLPCPGYENSWLISEKANWLVNHDAWGKHTHTHTNTWKVCIAFASSGTSELYFVLSWKYLFMCQSKYLTSLSDLIIIWQPHKPLLKFIFLRMTYCTLQEN